MEGLAARIYFGLFSGMLKRVGEWDGESSFRFDFHTRNRHPPRDPVNALLSLAYSLLTKDLTVACYAVGFDPMVGTVNRDPAYGSFDSAHHGRSSFGLPYSRG